MNRNVDFNCLLVPVDFSPASQDAIEWAMLRLGGSDPSLILMHVIDAGLVHTVSEHGFGNRESVVQQLRSDAESKLAALKSDDGTPSVSTLICEGVPFVEIIEKANDFAVDAVVMAKVGQRHKFETLLFGSTAEKVTRGCRQPVIVLPTHDHPDS